ncbi:clustered mitochondria protein [Anaeramoeba ignava]|uniref:Clustered mitochondria protein n=1 Tax=Anaeramoeba ignava TaxID=1746090 RepID=A0A9Q0LBW9_ANAIG|nr:clustered mitochondria protein [Anaeramoeba ignava]
MEQLKQNETNIEKYNEIMDLIGNFLQTATYCAQTIIDEYPLKKSDKTFKPLFKSKENHQLKKQFHQQEHFEDDQFQEIQYESSGLTFKFYHKYKPELENEELSMKMANHLIQNGKFIQEANILGIQIPLQCIVDYKGFRMHISAKLPQDKESVKLKDIQNLQLKQKIDLLLRKYGIAMNDEIMESIQVIELSGNENYLLNVEKFFPNEKSKSKSIEIKNLKENVVNRIRPELLVDIIKNNTNQNENDDISQIASDYLFSNTLPNFILQTDDLKIIPLDSEELKKEMHKNGINMRHLGVLANLTKIPHVRQLLMIDMIARICKKILFQQLRKTSKRIKNIESKEFPNLEVTEFDKKIMDSKEETETISNQKQIVFQTPNKSIKKNLFSEFNTPQNQKTINRINDNVSTVVIDFFNLVLGSSEECEMYWNSVLIPSLYFYQCNITLALNFLIVMNMISQKNYQLKNKILLQFTQSQKIFYNENIFDGKIPSNLNEHNQMIQNLNFKLSVQKSIYDYSNSILCANAALGASRKFHGFISLTYLILMKAKYQVGDTKSAIECFKYSLDAIRFHLTEYHPLLIDAYNEIAHLYQRENNIQYALKFYTKALELSKKVIGIAHSKTAWCFFYVGGCYIKTNNFQDALSNLESGLAVIDSLFGKQNFSASIFHFIISEILVSKGDLLKAKEHNEKVIEIQKNAFNLVQELKLENEIVNKNQIQNQVQHEIEREFEDIFKGSEKEYGKSEIKVILVKSIVQMGYIYEKMGENLKSNDFYEEALSFLKEMEEEDDEILEQIQFITRAILNLIFRTLPIEKQVILDKIKLEEIQGKSQTLKFPITKELFEDIVVEIFGQDQIKKYVYDLIEDFIQNGNKEALKKLRCVYLISKGEDLSMFEN